MPNHRTTHRLCDLLLDRPPVLLELALEHAQDGPVGLDDALVRDDDVFAALLVPAPDDDAALGHDAQRGLEVHVDAVLHVGHDVPVAGDGVAREQAGELLRDGVLDLPVARRADDPGRVGLRHRLDRGLARVGGQLGHRDGKGVIVEEPAVVLHDGDGLGAGDAAYLGPDFEFGGCAEDCIVVVRCFFSFVRWM